jgi:hypothetical protein
LWYIPTNQNLSISLIINKNEIAYLVSSCDKYKDLWDLHFEALSIYCQFKQLDKYLLSNYKVYNSNEIKTLAVGEDLSWSHMLIEALSLIDQDYILLTLDDFILRKNTDCNKLNNSLSILKENHDVGVIRLLPRPKSCIKSQYQGYNLVDPVKPYALSLQASLWRKSFLQSLLIPGESPWEFELNDKSQKINYKIITSNTDILGYNHHCVERGYFFPWDKFKFSKKYDCQVSRETLPLRLLIIWLIKKIIQKTRNFKN